MIAPSAPRLKRNLKRVMGCSRRKARASGEQRDSREHTGGHKEEEKQKTRKTDGRHPRKTPTEDIPLFWRAETTSTRPLEPSSRTHSSDAPVYSNVRLMQKYALTFNSYTISPTYTPNISTHLSTAGTPLDITSYDERAEHKTSATTALALMPRFKRA